MRNENNLSLYYSKCIFYRFQRMFIQFYPHLPNKKTQLQTNQQQIYKEMSEFKTKMCSK